MNTLRRLKVFARSISLTTAYLNLIQKLETIVGVESIVHAGNSHSICLS